MLSSLSYFLACPVFAALERSTFKERTKFQQRLFIYVAQVAIVFVERFTVRQL